MNESDDWFRAPVITNSKGKYALHCESHVAIHNAEIYGDVFFGFASYLNSGFLRSYVEVGRYCSIGRDVIIGLGHHNLHEFSTSSFFPGTSPSQMKMAQDEPKRRVLIEHDCWIGDRVIIAAGVTVGVGSVLAAGSIVTKDVPPYTITAGVPAREVKDRFEPKVIERLLESRWWKYDPRAVLECYDENIYKMIANVEMADLTEFEFRRQTVKS